MIKISALHLRSHFQPEQLINAFEPRLRFPLCMISLPYLKQVKELFNMDINIWYFDGNKMKLMLLPVLFFPFSLSFLSSFFPASFRRLDCTCEWPCRVGRPVTGAPRGESDGATQKVDGGRGGKTKKHNNEVYALCPTLRYYYCRGWRVRGREGESRA